MADHKKETERTFHYLTCAAFQAFQFKMSANAKEFETDLAVIAMSSRRTVAQAMRAVEKSPFKTVFVVDPESGKVGFALSQNQEYVAEAKKKGGGGGRPKLPPSPAEECCAICMAMGADGCLVLENMNCYCLTEGSSGSGNININEPLDQLWP
ncbi:MULTISPECIES: hypothetical protein [unclassified Aurantimonas]|uniref:hypothetical protein n=1 Tax=unclassified Aurantimonas TaxID=2638230 RepID=UPI002E17C9D0|nr:hypothetical protein [Aurantimonas sp. A3-2-R12]